MGFAIVICSQISIEPFLKVFQLLWFRLQYYGLLGLVGEDEGEKLIACKIKLHNGGIVIQSRLELVKLEAITNRQITVLQFVALLSQLLEMLR
jgi:hypothetical protein